MHGVYVDLFIISPCAIVHAITDLSMVHWSRHYPEWIEFIGSVVS